MKRSVIAYFMHEDELRLAQERLAPTTETEAFVLGEASDETIKELREAGLIVGPLEADADSRPETPGTGTRPLAGRRRRPIVFSDRHFAPSPELDLKKPNVFLIQIAGPLLSDYQAAFKANGIELMEAHGSGYYAALLTFDQMQAARALPFVKQVLLYDGDQTVPPSDTLADPLSPPPPSSGETRMLTLDVQLHREADLPAVIDWLDERHVPVAGSSGRKIRVHLLEDSPILSELAGLVAVDRMEVYQPPRLWNDCARALIGMTSAGGAAQFPLDGAGEVIAIADTGIDDQHPDFGPRLKHIIPRGRRVADDPHGHGTHVAGSCAGDGRASGGSLAGTAPAADIVFQSLLDAHGGLGGLPLDLGDLFEEAYVLGARVHNNSWGAATASTYTISSSEVDEFAARRRDMLIVFAAGNEGQAADRLHTNMGVVDWLSVGAPGTAKNALTVGASRSSRSSGGFSSLTWGQAWRMEFPDPPIATETISGNPECLAAFSSRGPSDDRRIKPDIVAPGTDILSCRSSRAPQRSFWGSHPTNAHYAFMGGTSMATPIVSGCAAVVRQYYRTERAHDPSAALVRATLINGARWLSGADSNASNPPGAVPAGNFDQGFGCLDMLSSLPGNHDPGFRLEFVDGLRSPQGVFARTGERRRFAVQVGAGAKLRVCLCFTDAPGRGLQNNLNLFVEDPNRRKMPGNHQLHQSLGLPDVDNNVEVVRVDAPAAGMWLIQIVASNLLKATQDFALVVTGDLQSPLQPI